MSAATVTRGLAVHEPAALGRRAGARALDLVLGLAAMVVLGVAVPAAASVASVELALVLAVLLPLVVAVASLVALFKGGTPGQVLLGLYHVRSDTGRVAPGRTWFKLALQTATFGLWILITPLTMRAGRSWFDRVAGLTLLDRRRPTVSVATAAAVSEPPTGWQSDGHLTQVKQPDLETDPAARTDVPSAPAAVAPAPTDSGMIRSVPFDMGRSPEPSVAAAGPEPRQSDVHVRDARVTRVVEHGPERAPVASLLVDGAVLRLDAPVVLGRAPQPRASLTGAHTHQVRDAKVSANHLAVGVDGDHIWAMDLRSTNGTFLQDGDDWSRLPAGERVPVRHGSRLRLGSSVIEVQSA